MAVSLYKPEFDLFIFAFFPQAACSKHTKFPKMKVLIQVSLTAPPVTSMPLLPKMRNAIWMSQGVCPDSD